LQDFTRALVTRADAQRKLALRALLAEIDDAARSDAKVLLTGESGVGKEIAARLIHDRSRRRRVGLVALNCAAIPESLLESELFGHVRGSFTGAHRDKPGLLELAHHGTIFLDEIGETSLRMQALLLRFLENGEIWRLAVRRRTGAIDVQDLPAELRSTPAWRAPVPSGASPADASRADDLYDRMVRHGESFWSAVHPLFTQRDMTRAELRAIVSRGLAETRGNYRLVLQLFNMPPEDYKPFLNLLRKHQCHIPYLKYRCLPAPSADGAPTDQQSRG
jgi:hypothetical protein